MDTLSCSVYTTYFNIKKGLPTRQVPRWIGIEQAAVEMDGFIYLVDVLKETIDHDFSKVESIKDREKQFETALSRLTRQYLNEGLNSPDPRQPDLEVIPLYVTQIGNLSYAPSDVYKVNEEFLANIGAVSLRIENSRAQANSLVEKANRIVYNLQNVIAQMEFVNDTLISLNEDILERVYEIVSLLLYSTPRHKTPWT